MTPPTTTKKLIGNTPLSLLWNGPFWVIVFFILSGFVLPLKFFQTKRAQCIWGGIFRRYPRLMVPLLVVLSIIYSLVTFGVTDAITYK